MRGPCLKWFIAYLTDLDNHSYFQLLLYHRSRRLANVLRTTGVACVKTGRKFIGIEIDEAYFKIAQERIAKTMVEAGKIDEMPESLASSLKNPAALSLY